MRIEESLLTDLYQLTMLDAYRCSRMADTAVFEMFVRRLPPGRGYLLAAGLEPALDYLENLSFDDDELDWLESGGHFGRDFVDWLAELRFTGDVWAMEEGEVFFADEPVLRVEAPLPEAQLVESRLINLLHFSTLVASKAARVVSVARGRTLVDFGMRRAHGAEAALFAARSSYLAGFDGTATVVAGRRYGIPLYGTMAHSFVQAHDSERQAFEDFARARPEGVVWLVDTYDLASAMDTVVALAPRLAAEGVDIRALRLDSGDLDAGARAMRARLDGAGLTHIGVFVSGNLDERKVHALVEADAPVTGFGVGTSMDVSADAPSLDIAYKLQAYAGQARRKRSPGKATWPGPKQVFRELDGDGRIAGDLVAPADSDGPGRPLLVQVMAGGRRTREAPVLDRARAVAAGALASLPAPALRLEDPEPVRAEIAPELVRLATEVDASAG